MTKLGSSYNCQSDPVVIDRMVYVINYEWDQIFLQMSGTGPPSVISGVPVSHILHHLSILCTWGNWWCVPPVVTYVVMVDESIYKSLSLVGNLRTSAPVGRVSSFATWG